VPCLCGHMSARSNHRDRIEREVVEMAEGVGKRRRCSNKRGIVLGLKGVKEV